MLSKRLKYKTQLMDIMWGGAVHVGEVQLHEMDWWAIRERQAGDTSDSDEDKRGKTSQEGD